GREIRWARLCADRSPKPRKGFSDLQTGSPEDARAGIFPCARLTADRGGKMKVAPCGASGNAWPSREVLPAKVRRHSFRLPKHLLKLRQSRRWEFHFLPGRAARPRVQCRVLRRRKAPGR